MRWPRPCQTKDTNLQNLCSIPTPQPRSGCSLRRILPSAPSPDHTYTPERRRGAMAHTWQSTAIPRPSSCRTISATRGAHARSQWSSCRLRCTRTTSSLPQAGRYATPPPGPSRAARWKAANSSPLVTFPTLSLRSDRSQATVRSSRSSRQPTLRVGRRASSI